MNKNKNIIEFVNDKLVYLYDEDENLSFTNVINVSFLYDEIQEQKKINKNYTERIKFILNILRQKKLERIFNDEKS